MYFARRLLTGGLSSIFASAAVACGEGARQALGCALAQPTISDVVIVATKATGLEAAAGTLSGHWPNAAVMTVQNGLGAEDVVAAHGAWPILSAVTFMSGTRHEDSHVDWIREALDRD